MGIHIICVAGTVQGGYAKKTARNLKKGGKSIIRIFSGQTLNFAPLSFDSLTEYEKHIYAFVSSILPPRFCRPLFRRFSAAFFQTSYVNSGGRFFYGSESCFSFFMCLRHCTTVQKHDIIII